ncbi:AIR synthase-related protein [Sorangium sp. wiwo2]|uniref:AIR synthase-related protein n=1 Tax=Sorangium atrum TaxID=2995308 RepID=A0ABT5C0C7_9BACT|nr:AIR synthase-related protein [Sorangium aterium]MDC0678652.1 AIR synthase-related protein [Sorangium aterium]
MLYVGAKTGRDGIHGATMASDEFSEGGPSQRPTVQVGDPFMEKLLLEACLEIFAEDLLVGVQDMGAAGLTSSSVEMAGRSGSGLDLDLVPRRAARLTPYEMLLSESQERMLLVAKPGCEARVIEICTKWELDAAIIGKVTDTGRWVVRATPGYDPLGGAAAGVALNPVVVCDLPVDFLTDAAPKYDRPQRDDASLPARRAFDPRSIGDPRGGPLGGSEYVARHTGEVKGPPPALDLDREARLQGLCLALARSRPQLLRSAHDVSEGGLAIALGECCAAADDPAALVGARVRLPDAPDGVAREPLAEALFGEAPSRIIVSVRPEDAAEVARQAKAAGVPCTELGTTGGDRLTIDAGGSEGIDVEVRALREARDRCLEPIVGR